MAVRLFVLIKASVNQFGNELLVAHNTKKFQEILSQAEMHWL
ncbi:MAG TPA: hypothetical protein VFC58_11755 [Desulfosporosinus sp.]|nr:hypothetical protein [Desulfosporosinus sp.]